jgi:hypothetical protein
MKAIANPVLVEFGVIIFSGEIGMAGHYVIRVDWGPGQNRNEDIKLDPEMTSRYQPVLGDYLVVQSDGYRYLNPKAVFERKYHRADGVAWEASSL